MPIQFRNRSGTTRGHFTYTDEYDSKRHPNNVFRMLVGLYALADKFVIPTLKELRRLHFWDKWEHGLCCCGKSSKDYNRLEMTEPSGDSMNTRCACPEHEISDTLIAEIIPMAHHSVTQEDRGLKAAVILPLLRRTTVRDDRFRSDIVENALKSTPEALWDLATLKILPLKFDCDHCFEKNIDFLYDYCYCGRTEFCREQDCIEKLADVAECPYCRRKNLKLHWLKPS